MRLHIRFGNSNAPSAVHDGTVRVQGAFRTNDAGMERDIWSSRASQKSPQEKKEDEPEK